MPLAVFLAQSQHIAVVDDAGALIDGGVLENHFRDVTLVHAQQIGVDPVVKLGGDFDVGLRGIHPFLVGEAHETHVFLALYFLADDDIREHIVVFAANDHPLAPPFQRRQALIERIQHAAGFVIDRVVGAKIVLAQLDDRRRGFGQLILAIGGVIVMRWDGPVVPLERDFERNRRTGFFVKIHHFQTHRGIRIRKFREE